jgi:hypothetical protein
MSFTYYTLPDYIQIRCHAIELHAVVEKLSTMLRKNELTMFLRKQLNAEDRPEAWSEVINAFVMKVYRKPIDKEDLALYYLAAGVGIKKAQALVGCGQTLIYKVRDREDWSRHHSSLESMLVTDTFTLHGLKVMTNAFNILNGYRVTESDQLPNSYDKNHFNFHNKPAAVERIVYNYTPDEQAKLQQMQEKMRAGAEEEKKRQLLAIMMEDDD